MKVNQSSRLRYFDVLLNGNQLESCLAADEEKGIAIIDKPGPDGKIQHWLGGNADVGDIVLDDVVVQKVEGKVEIIITVPDGMTELQIKEQTESDYVPDKIYKIVLDEAASIQLEPAFEI